MLMWFCVLTKEKHGVVIMSTWWKACYGNHEYSREFDLVITNAQRRA